MNISSQIKESLGVKRLTAIDTLTGRVIWKTDKVYPQHFYPLTIKDYCYAIKNAVIDGIDTLPILSISMKDFPYCDFKCVDCLACPSREWAIRDRNIKYPIIPIEMYKNILKEISNYSQLRGVKQVRFEICGEGNPDLYKYRKEMIEYASKECGMGIVYVSTGSKFTSDLIDMLVNYASCIRISFPGINKEAYDVYSGQEEANHFSYEDAINLLHKLSEARKKVGRQNQLLIGTRTCIRKLNAGSYEDFIRTIGALSIDAFQGVKVLTPDFAEHEDEMIDTKTIKELLGLKENYKNFGIQSFQIPMYLDSTYNNRSLDYSRRPSQCWSSLVSPIMYGTNVIACAHWDKITNPRYHYGIMEGRQFELEEIMHGNSAKIIAENCPKKCRDCCSYNDNAFMETLWRSLRTYSTPENVEFFFDY